MGLSLYQLRSAYISWEIKWEGATSWEASPIRPSAFLYFPALILSIPLKIIEWIDLISYSDNFLSFNSSINKRASAWFLTSKCSLKVFLAIVMPVSIITFVSISVSVFPSIAFELYVFFII